MLTRLKLRVQQMLASEAQLAHKIGLTPNIVSALGFGLSFLAAVAYALVSQAQPLWLLAGVFLLMASGFCDTLDGVLARTFQQASAFGGFLDSLLDRYADALVLSGVILSGAGTADPVFGQPFIVIAGLAALASSFMVSYSRARAEATGVRMESIGIAERPERIIILAGSSIAAIFWLPALEIGVAAIAVLATITVIQRGIHAYQSLKERQTQK
jgi:phosphatidylglycerophosphate synthase